jgi:hypothetical protein
MYVIYIINIYMYFVIGFSIVSFIVSFSIKPNILCKRTFELRSVSEPKKAPFEILKKINGFYGLIGPNIEQKKSTTLYDMFMGNGIVQGVFIENGQITYLKKEIETDKHKIEHYYYKLLIKKHL